MTGKKLKDRIKDGEEGDLTAGIPSDGTVDPTGEYPRRDNWFGSSVSSAARGVKINSLWMGGSTWGVSFNVPMSSASIYPFNQANETPSGHSFEIDDTPGGERILIKHNTGAGIELMTDGSVVVSSKFNRIEVVGADHNVVVQGQGNIVYDGDLNLTVNGDYNVKVNGTHNVEVGSNHHHRVNGSYSTETGDVHSTTVSGNKDVRVYGDTLDFHVGERKIVTKKDIRVITKNDFIVNSKRHLRFTAEKYITATAGRVMTLSSDSMNIMGKSGKVGSTGFTYVGSTYSGPKVEGKSSATFEGYLLGRALESWTSKYAINAQMAYGAKYAAFADGATTAIGTGAVAPIFAPPAGDAENTFTAPPTAYYKFDYGWSPSNTNNVFGSGFVAPIGDASSITPDWVDVWNKVSPFAVRKIYVDEDGAIEKELSSSQYSNFFKQKPDIQEIRSKMRSIARAGGTSSPSEMFTAYTKPDTLKSTLVEKNLINSDYNVKLDRVPAIFRFDIGRNSWSPGDTKYYYGYNLLGNPVERRSKSFVGKGQTRGNDERTIVPDPLYNPDRHDAPVTSSTKLSRTATVSKFLGAPGSKSSLDFVPLLADRQNLARQWYLHAMLMDGIASTKQFSDYRLQVTEGFYNFSSGIKEEYDSSKNTSGPKGTNQKYWREPFIRTDYPNNNPAMQYSRLVKSSGRNYSISELKHSGRAVVYTLYNSVGKIDFAATYDLAIYIRDHYFYDEVSLDYDILSPDQTLSAQIIVVMPEISSDFKAKFQFKSSTYFNRTMMDPQNSNDLIELISY